MSGRILYFTDLDNTLFQKHESEPSGIYPMAVDAEGMHHGFATPSQHDLFKMMAQTGHVIAVTARSHEKMERVIGWETNEGYDLALTDHGAALLVRNNKTDRIWKAVPSWHEFYQAKALAMAPQMTADIAEMRFLAQSAGLSQYVDFDTINLGKCDTPLYLTLSISKDHQALMPRVIECVAVQVASRSGYQMHSAANVVSLIPDFVNKGTAVQGLLALIDAGSDDPVLSPALKALEIDTRMIITAGDNLADIDFMQHGHFMLAPQQSDIAASVRHLASAHLQLTEKAE